jgi:hypothetical protein
MSTEDHSEHNINLTSRNHSHTPTPSNSDVNAEASLISSAQLFTTSASLLDCVDSMTLSFVEYANRGRENGRCAAGWEEDHRGIEVLRSVWYKRPLNQD